MADTAQDIIRKTLEFYGLRDVALVDEVWKAFTAEKITENSDIDAIGYAISETQAYKDRFAGNEILRQQGKPQFSVSEYLRQETAYANVLRSRAMPPGFYDDYATDFKNFIAGGVAPDELAARIDQGYQAVKQADPAVVREFKTLYGVSDADLAAYFIDPERARPQFDRYEAQRQAQAAQVAAEARGQANIGLTAGQAETLVRQGITDQGTARQGFSAIAEQQGLFEAQMLGEQAVSQEEQIAAIFGTSAAAAQRIATRRRRRRAAFEEGGSLGVTQTGITGLRTAGQ